MPEEKIKEKTPMYEGKVTRPFNVSQGYTDKDKKKRKPPKEYKVGDPFSTSSKEVYDDLINKKRIR